jgi:uncharacterized protein YndB with AHSA1/START domain
VTDAKSGGQGNLVLVVRRLIAANPERLFRAWTDASEFVRWWGPKDVVCESAEIDLRIGGAYRIANRLPSGQLIWISGAFEVIEPPRRIAYTWRTEPGSSEETRVVVSFNARGDLTEVLVAHERILSEQVREDHERGWIGCLDGLAKYMS